MGKYIEVCAFCGDRGLRTKEHVWAQWLRETAGAQALLAGTHGERSARLHTALDLDGDGNYVVRTEEPGPYAKWLPNVTVDVCGACNSGWMSELESGVKDLLEPLFQGKSFVSLSVGDLVLIATWATKSWMAYALTHAPLANPFAVAEYREMAAAPTPLARSRILLLHSEAPQAQVSLGVSSMLLGQGVPDLVKTQDNAGFGFLAAGGVVLFLVLAPDGAPVELMDAMVPPVAALSDVRWCWPDPRRQYFPLGTVDDGVVEALLGHPQAIHDSIAIPLGSNATETGLVFAEFMDGADPADLRSKWTTPSAGDRVVGVVERDA